MASANLPSLIVAGGLEGVGGVLPPPEMSAAISSGTAAKTMVSPVATAYFVMITDARRTGVASRCTMLPSSTSAPRTLVPISSADSGSSTVKPNTLSTWLCQSRDCRCAALSASVNTIRIRPGIANRYFRLLPSVARSVIEAMVGFSTGCSSFRDQVGEDAFQRLVGGQQFAHGDLRGPGQYRDLRGEGTEVGRLDQ